MKPDEQLEVDEWADDRRILSSKAASEAGKYRTSRTPFLRKIMQSLSAYSPYIRVVFMKATQVGASEAGNNWVGYAIEQVAAPFLLIQPTTVLAKRYSKQRIAPMIESTPSLTRLVQPSRSRDSGNTVDAKEYPGGILILTGANSAVGLRSMPARFLFADEIDAYPRDVDDEGDPVSLAEARAQTFGHRRKLYLVSTPTIKGLSKIEAEYDATDQQRYYVPCPHCGHMQHLRFEQLKWTAGKPETALYYCEDCGAGIAHHHKTEMLALGEWRATAKCDDPTVIGFHINSLYSPTGWTSWEDLARQWEAAQGDDSAIKTFKNTKLGESFQERGDAPDWKRLSERKREHVIGFVPAATVMLTAGVDVQRNRIEVSIYAWGYGVESWLVAHIIIEGDTALDDTWDQLSELVPKRFTRNGDDAELVVSGWGVDTGDGATTTEAYAWCRKHRSVAYALKGRGGFSPVPVTGPVWAELTVRGRKIKNGVKLFNVFVDVFKSETYRFLRLDRPSDDDIKAVRGDAFPDGYIHVPEGVPDEWVKQLVAEQLVVVKTKRKRALNRQEWIKLRDRNEALDCRVYARAIAWLLELDKNYPSKRGAPKPQRVIDAEASAKALDPPAPEETPDGDNPPPPAAPPAAPAPTREDVLRKFRERFSRK